MIMNMVQQQQLQNISIWKAVLLKGTLVNFTSILSYEKYGKWGPKGITKCYVFSEIMCY